MDLRKRVEALNTERLRAWEAGKALLEATEGRTMDAEELAQFERINAEITNIDAEVRQIVDSETREREAATLREHTLSVFGEVATNRNDAAGVDHFRAWLAAPRGSDLRSAQFEVDIQRVIKERDLIRQGATAEELRALAWDASSGSLVVPTTMARSLFDVMESSIAGFRIGATRINTSTGENMQLPKLTTHGIGSQIAGQGSAFAGGDPVFGRVDLNAYKYGQIVKVANELVSDAAFGIEQFLGQDLGYALGRVINTDLVVGSGSGEPTGMTLLAGAGTNAPVKTGGSLIAPTVEKFIDVQYSINDAYRANASWLMRDSVAGTVRKLRDGAGGTVGAFLWEPSLTSGLKDGTPDRFLGSPVFTDPNCGSQGPADAKVATYGDFSQYTIRTVGNPVIERDDSVYFASDEAAFRGKWRVGGNHRQVGALNNLTTTV
jgi:HK97 family phage major capsid protein